MDYGQGYAPGLCVKEILATSHTDGWWSVERQAHVLSQPNSPIYMYMSQYKIQSQVPLKSFIHSDT